MMPDVTGAIEVHDHDRIAYLVAAGAAAAVHQVGERVLQCTAGGRDSET